MTLLRPLATALAIVVIAHSVFGQEASTSTGTALKTPLRVALFPYIPDSGGDNHQRLMQLIEGSFETKHPDVDLQLRPISPADDFYDLDILASWLSGTGGAYIRPGRGRYRPVRRPSAEDADTALRSAD